MNTSTRLVETLKNSTTDVLGDVDFRRKAGMQYLRCGGFCGSRRGTRYFWRFRVGPVRLDKALFGIKLDSVRLTVRFE